MHDAPLITTLVAGFGLAFFFGAIAQRLRLSPLIGYLLAGVAIGPATPGYVADQHLAPELAEIGVILLMFGVGLHVSLRDVLSVRAIAIPGAVAQIGIATLLGMALAWGTGWPVAAGVDDRQDSMTQLRAEGVEAITGNAADDKVLEAANIAGADRLLVALPNVFEAGQVVAKARKANPDLHICARAETQPEVEHLRGKGADTVVVARLEVATAMMQDAFGPGAAARQVAAAAPPEPLPPPVDDVVA